MSTPTPPSPPASRVRRPSWLDLRIMVGVLLVLISVVLVSRIVAAADRSVRVWAVTHDVAAGTTLTAADLRPARVRLFDSAPAYLQVNRSPAGRMVSRALHAGELVPAAVLDSRPPGVIVSIPVRPENAPAVARGQLIDVWSTVKGCPPVRVLGGVAVQDVRATGGGTLAVSTGTLQVIVRVRADQAERVVAALGAETTIRLVVLDGAALAGRSDPGPAAGCLASGAPSGFRFASDQIRFRPVHPVRSGSARPEHASPGRAAGPGAGRATRPVAGSGPGGRR